MSSAITETGFHCPPEIPFEYAGDSWSMCAELGDLDAQAIDRAVQEAADAAENENENENENEPCTDFDQGRVCAEDDLDDRDPNVGARDDAPCTDFDQDGVCAENDLDDRDPSIGAIDSTDPTCEAGDNDSDGSCTGSDLDDQDPETRNTGVRWAVLQDDPNAYGQWELVTCVMDLVTWEDAPNWFMGSGISDSCVGIDICHLNPAGVEGLPGEVPWVTAAAGCDPDRVFFTSTEDYDSFEVRCDDAPNE
ncbi:MAG: hypothetical protein ACI9MR_004140, partial [Myxococcota bacterium]